MKDSAGKFKGFTLVELLIAMVITVFISSAVVTLAFAFTSANESGDEAAIAQAQVRYASLRLKELISHSKLVCAETAGYLVLWSGDKNGNNRMDVEEVVYIEIGSDNDYIQLLEFKSPQQSLVDGFRDGNKIALLPDDDVRQAFVNGTDYSRIKLVKSCSNVSFTLDKPAPYTELVSISFDIEVNGITENYQINAKLKCWAGHLLNSSGHLISDNN